MTNTQKEKIISILNDELGDDIHPTEFTYTVQAMSTVAFGNDGSVNKTLLNQACDLAIKYLNSITLPVGMLAMNAVYQNKVLIAVARITKELN